MRPLIPRSASQALLALAACCTLAGCALGPLASSNGADEIATASIAGGSVSAEEIHSASCDGLALERRERVKRIAALQPNIAAELGSPPATIAQALQRVSAAPETGTTAYAQIAQERTNLEAAEALAARKGCPAEAAGTPH